MDTRSVHTHCYFHLIFSGKTVEYSSSAMQSISHLLVTVFWPQWYLPHQSIIPHQIVEHFIYSLLHFFSFTTEGIPNFSIAVVFCRQFSEHTFTVHNTAMIFYPLNMSKGKRFLSHSESRVNKSLHQMEGFICGWADWTLFWSLFWHKMCVQVLKYYDVIMQLLCD